MKLKYKHFRMLTIAITFIFGSTSFAFSTSPEPIVSSGEIKRVSLTVGPFTTDSHGRVFLISRNEKRIIEDGQVEIAEYEANGTISATLLQAMEITRDLLEKAEFSNLNLKYDKNNGDSVIALIKKIEFSTSSSEVK